MAKPKATQEGWFATTKEIVVILVVIFLIRTFGFGLYQVPTGSMETTMLVGERFFADKFTPLFRSIQHEDIISLNDPTYPYAKNPVKNWWQMYVWGPSNWTKRVIGIPGDTITGVVEAGKAVVYRNGTKLDESYVNSYPLIEVLSRPGGLFSQRHIIWRSYDPHYSYKNQPFYRIDPRCIVKGNDGKPVLLEPGVGSSSPVPEHVRNDTNYWDRSDEFHIKLGSGQYWLMGDNRRGSSDSRVIGPVDGSLIHGRIVFRLLSIDSQDASGRPDASWFEWFTSFLIVDMVIHPIDFWKRVRWRRLMQPVG